jgi:hypothetical protein
MTYYFPKPRIRRFKDFANRRWCWICETSELVATAPGYRSSGSGETIEEAYREWTLIAPFLRWVRTPEIVEIVGGRFGR